MFILLSIILAYVLITIFPAIYYVKRYLWYNDNSIYIDYGRFEMSDDYYKKYPKGIRPISVVLCMPMIILIAIIYLLYKAVTFKTY